MTCAILRFYFGRFTSLFRDALQFFSLPSKLSHPGFYGARNLSSCLTFSPFFPSNEYWVCVCVCQCSATWRGDSIIRIQSIKHHARTLLSDRRRRKSCHDSLSPLCFIRTIFLIAFPLVLCSAISRSPFAPLPRTDAFGSCPPRIPGILLCRPSTLPFRPTQFVLLDS